MSPVANEIQLLNSQTLELEGTLSLKGMGGVGSNSDTIESLAFGKDGELLAVGHSDRSIRIWKLPPNAR